MNTKAYYIFVIVYIFLVGTSNLLSSKLFGIGFYSLYSTSMEPEIPPGSLIAIKKSINEYQIGDVVAYWSKENDQEVIVAHRIIKYGGNVYVTKGDNNQTADSQVILPRLIIGKMILNIPYLGFVFSLFTTKIGTYIFISIPALIIIFIEFLRIKKILSEK